MPKPQKEEEIKKKSAYGPLKIQKVRRRMYPIQAIPNK